MSEKTKSSYDGAYVVNVMQLLQCVTSITFKIFRFPSLHVNFHLIFLLQKVYAKVFTNALYWYVGGLINFVRFCSVLQFFCVLKLQLSLIVVLCTVLLIMVAIAGVAIALCFVVVCIGCCYLKRYFAIFLGRITVCVRIDAAFCYIPSNVVCRSVGLSQ